MKATLNDGFDAVIEGLPEVLVRAPDLPMLAGTFDDLSLDPHGPLADLRKRMGPVVRRDGDGTFGGLRFPNIFMQDENHPIFLVLGYDAHTEVMRSPEVFVNGDGAYGPHEVAVGKIITLSDGDRHTSYRKLLHQAFGRPAVGRLHDELVDPIASWLVDRVARRIEAGEPTCFAKDIGVPMAYKVMTSLLGLPDEKFAYFIELGAALFNAPSDFEAGMAASASLYELYAEELADRRQAPRDDLITWLANAEIDGEALSDDDIIIHARFMLPAGIETTARSIALMGLALLSEPSRYAEVRDDPTLIEAAVEESHRHSPSGFVVPRRAVVDATVAGVEVPAGSFTVSLQGIINRDPAKWPDPERFDLHRPPVNHMTFNTGIHLCMGMHLAKLEMAAVLREVTTRLPDLKLACDPDDVVVEGIQIRSPRAVPLTV